jgi:microsomal dipeptidase-like Zn-dependent dipeptidase
MVPDAAVGPLLEPWRETGIDYFSINLYYDPVHWPPDAAYDRPIDFLPLNSLPEVCDELIRLGFSMAKLAGVLGGNFRRIALHVWT